MREIRTYGSEGGEALRLPDPYHRLRGVPRCTEYEVLSTVTALP